MVCSRSVFNDLGSAGLVTRITVTGDSEHLETITTRQDVSRITLERFCVFNTSYPVNQYNKTGVYSLDLNSRTITLNEGYYTAVSLASALKSKLQDAFSPSSIIDVVYDSLKGSILITTSGPELTIACGPDHARLIGLGTITSGVSGLNIVHNLGAVPQVVSTIFYKLRIKDLSTSSQDYFTIINDCEAGGLLSFDKTVMSLDVQLSRLRQLEFQLLDENDRLVNLRGTKWTAVLAIESKS